MFMYTGMDFKIARIRSGVKAIDFARSIGISTSRLSLVENGHIECTEDLYLKIVDALSGNLEGGDANAESTIQWI